jgi:hypothetical protein
LFALFTAAGTWALSRDRRAATEEEFSTPATTAAQPTNDLPLLKPATEPIEPTLGAPTAAGPLGSKAPRTGWRNRHGKRLPPQSKHSAAGPSSAASVASAKWQLVPEVQTTDPTDYQSAGDSEASQAVARLQGFILETPTQQAHHDDDQSSLH